MFHSWQGLMFRFSLALLVLGSLATYFGYHEWRLAAASPTGPQDLTVEELLARGPGGNPFVHLRGFVLDDEGYVTQEDDSDKYETCYIPALSKANAVKSGPAKVIVVIKHLADETNLDAARAYTSMTGMVTPASDLGAENKDAFAEQYPETDFNKSLLFQEGRHPMESSNLLLLLAGGPAMVVIGAMMMVSRFVRF